MAAGCIDQVRAKLGVARMLLTSLHGASKAAASRTQVCAVVESTKAQHFRLCSAGDVTSLQEMASKVPWFAPERLDTVMQALATHQKPTTSKTLRREQQDVLRILDKFTQADWGELLPRGEGHMQVKKRCITRRALLLNLTCPSEGTEVALLLVAALFRG